MELSDDLSQLDQGLREAGQSGRLLRYYLLRHFSELVQRLTCSLESDVQQGPLAELAGAEASASKEEAFAVGKAQSYAPYPASGTTEGPMHGKADDAYLREVRAKALEVFEERSLSGQDYVALWIDAVPVGGRSLMLCMAVTSDGYRHMLACYEATLQDAAAVRKLLQGLRKRGLCVDRGLLCITSRQAQLMPALTESLGTPLRLQHCQMAKRERVVSYLADEDRRSVRGAITRAFQEPEPDEAHAALMRIHAALKPRNRSAARWLLRDLEHTLTLHRTGLYELLSPSLRGTRSLAHNSRQLLIQLRGLRHWLPPQERRAQMAYLLLEMESRMRRLAHASQLVPMRSALFTDEASPLQS